MSLAPLDYVMICVPLAVVTAIAVALRPYMRSVADFLAAGRCAGRYLISTSVGQMGSAAMAIVTYLEVFSRTGFSIQFWLNFTGLFVFMFTLLGVTTYRLRETRCLTFHEFFEMRYSKGIRVFSSAMSFVSGVIAFGLTPAVGARFFVYFCGMPETLLVGGVAVPTFAVLMIVLMAMSLLLALTGGQISVMVTDCIEGLISSVFYLVVAFFILSTVSTAQMKTALLSGAAGSSYINPFDMGAQPDFNGWYILLVLIFNMYIYRGGAWQQGFNAAARSAHEGKMAGIIGTWRGFGCAAMVTLISLGAFTLLHHPDFAAQQQLAMDGLKNIGSEQLRTQMTMPMALGVLLAPGVKGAFCAVCLFGLLSSQSMALHGFGSTLLQDVVLPLRRRAMSPAGHLRALRWATVAVGVFVCIFSILYKPADYLTMVVTLIGAIYLGGVGAVVWGGLYWKKGTTAAAWAAMVTGAAMALASNLLLSFWTSLQPLLLKLAGDGVLAGYLASHPDKCPINGQQFSTATAIIALTVYVAVSLLTCREQFDMDRMLHRGRYAVEEESGPLRKHRFRWSSLIGVDEHYTRSDKGIACFTFFYTVALKCISISIIIYWLVFGRQSDQWWFDFTMLMQVRIPMLIAVITTIWLTVGTFRDLRGLLKTLRQLRPDEADNGMVQRPGAKLQAAEQQSHADSVHAA